MTIDKIKELDGIEPLPQSSYIPDLTPSDYCLFRYMEHFRRGKQFKNVADVRI